MPLGKDQERNILNRSKKKTKLKLKDEKCLAKVQNKKRVMREKGDFKEKEKYYNRWNASASHSGSL